MKEPFKVKKIPLEDLLNLLMDLYEKGVDFVDLTADHSSSAQDKLIVSTDPAYLNKDWVKDKKRMDKLEGLNNNGLTEDDINSLL